MAANKRKNYSINGLSLEEIERRSRPLLDKTTDKSWMFRSHTGFLGESEGLLDVIESDRQILLNRKTNHMEVASILRNLINNVEDLRISKVLGPMTPISIEFSLPLTSSLSSIFGNESQTLIITRNIFGGYQTSLFFNSELQKSEENTQWNDEYSILNPKLDIDLLIAGNSLVGIIDYIDRYGFFEGGGISNTYRLEPEIIFFVLSGRCSAEALDLIRRREDLKIRDMENQLLLLESSRSNHETENENKQYLEGKFYLETEISRQKEISRQFICNLELFQLN